jgi:N,N'-diacetyllegionaminate synthase
MRTIIAELCQNHQGDLKLLDEMVWAAAESGATYAKIQSMLADHLTRRERFETGQWEDGQQTAIQRPHQPEYERLKPMDLDDEAHHRFIETCRKAGIQPLTTIFSRARIPFIASLGLPAIKVASYDCASFPMLEELKARFDHLFVSVGASRDEEIEQAAALLQGHPFTFLHAVTIYPTPLTEIHLARLDYLRQFSASVGFSDHTLVARDGLKASIAAMSWGADVVERHFRLLPEEATKDGPVSIGPDQLKELVRFAGMDTQELREYVEREIPELPQMIGQARRELSPTELLNRDYYRGRFASPVADGWVYNWEEREVF